MISSVDVENNMLINIKAINELLIFSNLVLSSCSKIKLKI